MNTLPGTDSEAELAISKAIDTISKTKTTACQSSPEPVAIEDGMVLEPEVVAQKDEGRYRESVRAGVRYKPINTQGWATHFGDNIGYHITHNHYQTPSRRGDRDIGFDFDMVTLSTNTPQLSAYESAYESREVFTSKKRPDLPMLLDHQQAYKTYTPVKNPEVRLCLEQIARLFTDLDEFFAAMFVHVVASSDDSKLSGELARIRGQIASRQGDNQDSIYLGDLGHYCEALLKQNGPTESNQDATTSLPEFKPTHSDEQSWIDYLEDGFEIPYWKLMLKAFSTSRLKKSTLGGKVIATALISMRADIMESRCTLQQVLKRVSEDIEGILSVVDKRIEILQGFTDRVALDKRSRNGSFKTEVNNKNTTNDTTAAKPNSSAANQSSTSDPLLLVTLVLLTLIAAVVPFTLGFKASNETGTASDADFWYNISSSIFTIMANFVMIIQLTQGSRFSKQYMYVWIWFILGIVCAIVSMAIYPFCNTAWSSIMSFFATIAGFGATLSVAMTVANPRSDEPLAKKKVE